MSGIAGFANLYSIVKALQAGNTYAGLEVNMEPGTTMDQVHVPTIDVYGGVGRVEVAAKDFQLTSERQLLRLELLAPASFTVKNGRFGDFTFDTSASPGPFLALMWRQCLRVLLYDTTPFAIISRSLIERFHRVEFRSELFEVDKGQRVGARTVEIECDLMPEPRFGCPPEGIWADFIAELRSPANTASDPNAPALAALLEDSMASPAGALSWQVEAAMLGGTPEDLRHLGLASYDSDAPDHRIVGAQTVAVADSDGGAIQVNADDPEVPEA